MQKFLSLVFSTLILLGSPFGAEAAIPTVHASIDVKPGDSGGAVKDKGKGEMGNTNGGTTVKTDKFDSTRVRQTGISLEIEARNTGSDPVHVRVEWVFYDEPVDGKGAMSPHSKGGQDLALPAAGTQHLTAESGSIASTTKKHMSVATGSLSGNVTTKASIEHSGRKLTGWYVRLLSGGQVVQVRASGPSFEKLGQTEK